MSAGPLTRQELHSEIVADANLAATIYVARRHPNFLGFVFGLIFGWFGISALFQTPLDWMSVIVCLSISLLGFIAAFAK